MRESKSILAVLAAVLKVFFGTQRMSTVLMLESDQSGCLLGSRFLAAIGVRRRRLGCSDREGGTEDVMDGCCVVSSLRGKSRPRP